MSEFNFSQLQSLQTPDEWIETAINIPHKKPKPRPFFLRPSFTATAAASVVVAAVVMTLLLHSGGGEPPRNPALVFPAMPVTTAAPTTQPTMDSTAATRPTGAAAATATTQQSTSSARMAATTVPAAAPSSATPLTTAATTTATAPATAATLPTAARTTAAQETTQLFTEPLTDSTEMIPAFEHVWFKGGIDVSIVSDSRFFDDETVCVRIDSADGFCGLFSVAGYDPFGGEEFSPLYPYLNGVLIPSGESCIVTVFDGEGNSKEIPVVFPEKGMVYIDVRQSEIAKKEVTHEKAMDNFIIRFAVNGRVYFSRAGGDGQKRKILQAIYRAVYRRRGSGR